MGDFDTEVVFAAWKRGESGKEESRVSITHEP